MVVAYIPLRGGSKSIPLKNIKLIAGRPLAHWVVSAALDSACIQKVFVATDSSQIVDCLRSISSPKLEIIGRNPSTATDNASSESALVEFCHKYCFENVFFIQATSPLLRALDLDNAWKLYQEKGYDSLLSVVRQRRFIWECRSDGAAYPVNYNVMQRPRRQEWGGFFVENGAFYLSQKNLIVSTNCRVAGKIGLYEMSEESYLELDEPHDWFLIEQLLLKY